MIYPSSDNSSHSDDDSTAYHDGASVEDMCLQSFSEGVRFGRQLQRDKDDERLSRYKARMQAQVMEYRQEVLLRKRYFQEMQFLQSQLLILKDELLATRTAYEELSSQPLRQFEASSIPFSSTTLPDRQDFVFDEVVDPSGPAVAEDLEDDFDALQQIQFMEHEDSDQLVDDAEQSRIPVELDDLANAYPNTESPSDSSELDAHASQVDDLSEIASLISTAHEGDSAALKRVRTLIRAAQRIPKSRRSADQSRLLACWRRPRRPPAAATLLPDLSAPEIFVDASAHGIGFIFNNRWLAWKFITTRPPLPLGPDGKLIMSWAELIAVEMGIRTLIAAGFRNVPVTVHSDNQGVVAALNSGKWTQKYGLDEIVRRLLVLCGEAALHLKIKWISTKENPADKPSRGVYPPAELAFQCRPSMPLNLSELIQAVE